MVLYGTERYTTVYNSTEKCYTLLYSAMSGDCLLSCSRPKLLQQYSTEQYGTARYSTVRYGTAQHSTGLYCIIWHCITQNYYFTVLYYTLFNSIILFYTKLCLTMLY